MFLFFFLYVFSSFDLKNYPAIQKLTRLSKGEHPNILHSSVFNMYESKEKIVECLYNEKGDEIFELFESYKHCFDDINRRINQMLKVYNAFIMVIVNMFDDEWTEHTVSGKLKSVLEDCQTNSSIENAGDIFLKKLDNIINLVAN